MDPRPDPTKEDDAMTAATTTTRTEQTARAREAYEAAWTRCDSRWATHHAHGDAAPTTLYAHLGEAAAAYAVWREARHDETRAKRQAESDYAAYRAALRSGDGAAELEIARARQGDYEDAQERECATFRAWCQAAEAAAEAGDE